MAYMVLSIGITLLMWFLSVVFKVGAKLRLTLPIVYFLAAVISIFFTDWTTKNEQLVLNGLYILVGVVALSWVYSLIKTLRNKRFQSASDEALKDYISWQIKKARENGIDINSATFDSDGHMRDATTGEQIIF